MGFLDSESWENANVDYHRTKNSLQEKVANEFAAAFLMPADMYREQLEKNTDEDGTVNIEAIAKYFGVSCNMAQNRGHCLGVLSW